MEAIEWFKDLFFGGARVNPAGWLAAEPPSGDPLAQGPDNYVRFRLVTMELKTGRRLLTQHVPSLQSVVSIKVGTRTVEVANTVGPDTFKEVGGSFRVAQHQGIFLTNWLPYNGDAVGLLAGLISVPKESGLVNGINAVSTVADLVQVPAISSVIDIASKVASAASTVFSSDEKIPLLGAEVQFSDDEVRPRFYLSVDADKTDYPLTGFTFDPSDQSLSFNGATVDDMDFFVIEMQTRRSIGEEWDSIPAMVDPYNEAVAQSDDPTKSERLMRQAWATALQSSDLTRSDRQLVADRIKARWKLIRDDIGAPTPLEELDEQREFNE